MRDPGKLVRKERAGGAGSGSRAPSGDPADEVKNKPWTPPPERPYRGLFDPRSGWTAVLLPFALVAWLGAQLTADLVRVAWRALSVVGARAPLLAAAARRAASSVGHLGD